jgi:chromosome partitioning protein
MNVITLASRKGGAGKSTLTAHLVAHAQSLGHRCLVIDADPQGSLTLWQSLRKSGEPHLKSAERGIVRALAFAEIDRYDYVFIDTAPTMWVTVEEAIRAATLVVVPARPGFFDLNAVLETVKAARKLDKPYAVALNAAPAKRDDRESPVVTSARAFLESHGVPVWWGQVTQRAGYSLTLAAGASASELAEENTAAAAEISGLWTSIAKSIAAINAAHAAAAAAATGEAGRAA